VFQYKEEAEDYHKQRLLRKEKAVKSHIVSILNNTTFEVKPDKIPYIFKENNFISELSKVHKMPINIYDLNGNLLISSRKYFGNSKKDSLQKIPLSIIDKIDKSPTKRFVIKKNNKKFDYQSSFSYIYDRKYKPIAVLNLPYLADSTFYKDELREFLKSLAKIYVVLFLLATLLSYILSRYITKSLSTINQMLQKTSLEGKKQKILLNNPNEEINELVNSYNSMVDKLDESAKKLAQTEREQAWREVAKQVAHEIKNPLTPMRLNIQSFQMTFDPSDPDIKNKFNEFSNMLIQQIDLMSNIASGFSNFAQLPKAQMIEYDLVDVVKNSIMLFDPEIVHFTSTKEKLLWKFDKEQIMRVVTNLVENALQSIPQNKTPNVQVIIEETKDKIFIKVKDNGSGIPDEVKNHIFEPKFTTKSKGMGLGLAIVKRIIENHGGIIYFKTKINKGTTFIIEFKK
jgi:nitrogen fixation/metabolism regulation signal transduction histidine kinase